MALSALIRDPPPVSSIVFYYLPLLFFSYLILLGLYNLYLHPLASYPGPLLSRAYPFPHAWRIVSGRGPMKVHAMHEKYGPVMRIGPNHLSYTDLRAWKDVFGHVSNNADDETRARVKGESQGQGIFSRNTHGG
ncbi:hypothetical protein N0V88_007954 [Collariella sp. IMI 366227]|nr:hypothetical protein N0V88_007954 [Collariella sp. IMI 366227]